MNNDPAKSTVYHERLLDDIFLDEDLARFKEDVLNQCQCELARQRRRTHGLFILAGAAAVLLLALILSHAIRPPSPTPGKVTVAPDYLVHTTALPGSQVVRTTSTMDVALSRETGCIVNSEPGTTDLIVREQYRVTRMTDSDMLNEFKGIACGIIHRRGSERQFVFFDPRDTERFFHRD